MDIWFNLQMYKSSEHTEQVTNTDKTSMVIQGEIISARKSSKISETKAEVNKCFNV